MAVGIRLLVVNVADHVVVVGVVHLDVIGLYISREKFNLLKQHGLLHLSTNNISKTRFNAADHEVFNDNRYIYF